VQVGVAHAAEENLNPDVGGPTARRSIENGCMAALGDIAA
jgi:hypothetical protein